MKIVEFLISNGANIDSGGYNDETALHIVSRNGDLKMARFLNL